MYLRCILLRFVTDTKSPLDIQLLCSSIADPKSQILKIGHQINFRVTKVLSKEYKLHTNQNVYLSSNIAADEQH